MNRNAPLKLRLGILAGIMLLPFLHTTAQSLFPINLSTIEGEKATISPLKSSPITVFVFLLPDCPACQSYTLTLKTLHKDFSRAGIRFIGVFAGKFSKQEEMIAFQKEYELPFPLYVDLEHRFIRQLQVHVSPEVVVLDQSGNILYRGRIDDWMYAVGKKRKVIRHHDLRNALESIKNGSLPDPSATSPVGCIIE